MSPNELATYWFNNGYTVVDIKARIHGIMYGRNTDDETRALYSEALNKFRELNANV